MEIKNDRMYSESHEWVLFEEETTALMGLSDYAQSELGDLVFVNLPTVGDTATKGEALADVESVKAVSDVYSPVSGSVRDVNEALLDAPEKINQAPYEAWFCRIGDITNKEGLMTAEEYQAFVEKQ